MNQSSHDPAADRILGDLAPVRRLARPWRRAVPVCALGLVVAVAVNVTLGVRNNAALLGAGVLWGLSAVQMGYAVLLIATALRTAVPGRAPARRRTAQLLLAGGAVILGITWITWLVDATRVPSGLQRHYWAVCLRMPIFIGLPTLALTLTLAFRAYPTRPLITGALAGLGAGLLSDGTWRTYCEVSDPVHVFTTHTLSVVLLMLTGMAIAWAVERRSYSAPWFGPR
jgi:hypothetical protein